MYIIFFASYGIMTCALSLFLFHEYIVHVFIVFGRVFVGGLGGPQSCISPGLSKGYITS